ncbi:hypothetical protein [Nocardioides sp.]|uniref:hypothetical protein n=1 Tax=Nocardioides sp. TaxID=35761 RepID=UPI002B26623C|nr:hypothetical protein [Nocardioides sp.]
MGWTRSPWMRLIALAIGVALVVTEVGERGAFFWLGIAIVVLNGIGLVAMVLAGSGPAVVATERPERPEPAREEVDVTLAELRDLPSVAQALAAAPPQWRQVTYFDDAFDPTDLPWLADYVWLTTEDDGWGLGLGDEVKPYVDLDMDESDDPVLTVFTADPRVATAYHEDREVYRVETGTPMTTEEFAVLAIEALSAHHLRAAGGQAT